MSGSSVVMVTTSSETEAEKIAKQLVENKLAACVSIIPKMRSIYIWEDEVQDDEEFLMIIKTRGDLFDKVRDNIKSLHSYSVPEIISLPITHALDEYVSWINDVTK
jgi:periplasmic divalent cation tolerance protein